MPRRGGRFAQGTRVKLVGGALQMRFEGRGIDAWLERNDHFRAQAFNMRPVFDAFGPYMLGSIDRNFEAEGRPTKWHPLAEATIRERIRLGYGKGPILQRTRRLRNGFRTHTSNSFLRILNNVPYFKFHQQDKRRGHKIPRRIMVLLQDRDKAQFTRLVHQHFGVEQ
jgi:phage gpG-like protein